MGRAKNAMCTYSIDSHDLFDNYLNKFYEVDFDSTVSIYRKKFTVIQKEDIEDALQDCLIDMATGASKTTTESYSKFKSFVYSKLNSRLKDISLRQENFKDTARYPSSLDEAVFEDDDKYTFIADIISVSNTDPYEVMVEYYDTLSEEDYKEMMKRRARHLLTNREFDMYSWLLENTNPGLRSPSQTDYANYAGVSCKTACVTQKSYLKKLSNDLIFKLLLYCTVATQHHWEVEDPEVIKDKIERMYI